MFIPVTCAGILAITWARGATIRMRSGSASPFEGVTQQQWGDLYSTTESRLHVEAPLARNCFQNVMSDVPSGTTDVPCSMVMSNYTNRYFRVEQPNACMWTQWESCQTTGERCGLDDSAPSDPLAFTPPATCGQGSVSRAYIDVQKPSDASAAFKFSAETKVPIVIKLSGHDFKGRSSAPNSLLLWSRNLQSFEYNPNFVPDQCTQSTPGVTMGGGTTWEDAYHFADAHNITLVGGASQLVGTGGGWMQGDHRHSLLTPTKGLGVDGVLQFKIVTPDGTYRTVNHCQNQDLFWALRGGGGGTFGFVTEVTVTAFPVVKIQAVVIQLAAANATKSSPALQGLWKTMLENQVTWSTQGWGGATAGPVAYWINTELNSTVALESLKPMLDYAKSLGSVAKVQIFTDMPNWLAFYKAVVAPALTPVGANYVLSSRLVSADLLATDENRQKLIAAFAATDPRIGVRTLAVTPYAYQGYKNDPVGTSVTPAWRTSVLHVLYSTTFPWNATTAEKQAAYQVCTKDMDALRSFTPPAAYGNEADVYEPDFEQSFWGDNYHRLLQLKHKYDPLRLLDCWQCVGFKRWTDRFTCYLDI